MRQPDDQTNVPRDDDWVSCENCRTWMVPLAKHEVESVSYSLPGRDDVLHDSFWWWGWIHFVALAVFGLFVVLYEEIVTAFRRRKLAKLKAEILPQFPNSQVCPRCLKVQRRK